MDDDQFEAELDESGRVRLYTTCPAGHPSIQAFTSAEWLRGLTSGSITFECLYCGTRWEPTAMQRHAILAEFES